MPERSSRAPEPPSPSDDAPGALASLGTGGSGDRLHFRLVVGILWRCLQLLRPVRGHVLALCGGFVVLAILFLPPVLLAFDLFWTRVLQGESLPAFQTALFGLDAAAWSEVPELSGEQRRQLARWVVWGGLGVFAVLAPMVGGLYVYQVWILQRVNQELRLRLLDRLQTLSLRFHADSRVGDAIYRLYQDSAMVTQLIEVLVLVPLSATGRFLFCVVVVAAFDPALAAVLAASWPPTLLMGAWFSKRLRTGFRAAREANSRLTSRIQETLSGIRVIKAYGAEGLEQERFDDASRTAFDHAFSVRQLFAVFQVGVFWAAGTAALTGVAAATLQTRDAAELAFASAGWTAWNLGLFHYFRVRVGDATNAVRDLYKTWGRVQDVAIGLDRVFEVLDLEPEVQDARDAVPLEGVGGSVAFREVTFGYQPEHPVLEKVDLEAPTGSVTALVGPTGSGKSTLMALLLRLFDPDEGRVEIDGRDLRRFTTRSLREQVSIALQENVLFGDSVRENIRYAVPHASDEAVREAARVACAHEFIEKLPQGYDTLLGERGTKLSTGQRQRISIARAVLKDTPILVLDEPTASLDAATEIAVLRNLAEWGRGRVVFLVTHRLSTIRRADRIVYLHHGRVVESGAHDELLARPDGAYRALVESEQGGLAERPAAGAAR